MLCISGIPKAESVVVLTGENEPGHSRIGGGLGDLIGIEVPGIEEPGVGVAVTPLAIGEGVDSEMDEAVELVTVPE